jgi:hypothetical protein
MASYYIKNQHRTCITLNSRKDELYKQGAPRAPHTKSAGKLNTSVPTSNVFISNLDTLFQNSQQMNSSARIIRKHKNM